MVQLATDTPAAGPVVVPQSLSIAELILAYARHCDAHYLRADGSFAAERDHIRLAVRTARQVHGTTPADQFGPLALKTVRQAMIDAGLSRNTINQRIGRIARVFRWATENELLPASIYQTLDAVEGLKKGGLWHASPRRSLRWRARSSSPADRS